MTTLGFSLLGVVELGVTELVPDCLPRMEDDDFFLEGREIRMLGVKYW